MQGQGRLRRLEHLRRLEAASIRSPLAEGFGDATVAGQGKKAANEIHSVFAWDAGDKAYAVIVDNEEGPDVDIVDISNPKKPALIAEYDLDRLFPQIVQNAPSNLVEIFHHDMVVKKIGRQAQIMLVSYWDGGYVTLDVTDPTKATYLADSEFADRRSATARAGRTCVKHPKAMRTRPSSRRTSDYIVAADEDFSSTGLRGDDRRRRTRSWRRREAVRRISRSTTRITGPTRYVGRACPGDVAVPDGDAEPRSQSSLAASCTFTEKIATVAAAGYAAAIMVNREGFDGCGPFGMSCRRRTFVSFSIERSAGFGLFDKEADYDNAACLTGTEEFIPEVGIGQSGDIVTLEAFFDGWGYVHLFKNEADGNKKLIELDTFAIPEAMDPDYADGFGDLSVHEAATSPTAQQPHLLLVLLGRVPRARRSRTRSSSRLVVSSTRAVTTSGASRSSPRAARSSSPPATWTTGCTSSSTRPTP